MKLSEKLTWLAVGGVLIAGVGLVVFKPQSGGATVTPAGPQTTIIDVKIPERLSAVAQAGKKAFDQNCAACHGANGAGTKNGPPFIHTTYNPGHHADEAFGRAVKNGVQQHHWRFGNMPPQPQVNRQQLYTIVAYVREMQEFNDIVYQ